MESVTEPLVALDARFSSEGATATPWARGRQHLADTELFWLSTVRPEGRPHVTPLLAVWLDDALYFCTGAAERKAKNIAQNPHCVLTTGSNALHEGLDVVVEGDAVRVDDDAALQRIADAYEAKYGKEWHFDVRGGAFHGDAGNVAHVFEVAPVAVFGFAKGDYSQTRWSFGRPEADR